GPGRPLCRQPPRLPAFLEHTAGGYAAARRRPLHHLRRRSPPPPERSRGHLWRQGVRSRRGPGLRPVRAPGEPQAPGAALGPAALTRPDRRPARSAGPPEHAPDQSTAQPPVTHVSRVAPARPGPPGRLGAARARALSHRRPAGDGPPPFPGKDPLSAPRA